MADWDHANPIGWAQALGMVRVPLFGGSRLRPPIGQHDILLDGHRASFALSIGDVDAILTGYDPSTWSWSSNLNRSLIVDRGGGGLVIRRWDRPGEDRKYSIPNRRELGELVRSFAAEKPPAAHTVVAKMLRDFRRVRNNIEGLGGTHGDSVRTFNALLAWADAVRQEIIDPARLGNPTLVRQVIPILEDRGLIDFRLADLALPAYAFPIVSLLDVIFQKDPNTNLILDPDLFIRHASGRLYQEAHHDLSSSPQVERASTAASKQMSMFEDDFSLDDTPARGAIQRDAHFTPPALARALVQEALREIRQVRSLPQTFKVLDPACGSGVFLIEAARELEVTQPELDVDLNGVDRSFVSQIMTNFCLFKLTSDESDYRVTYRVVCKDSLKARRWGAPDLILMNPPFISWQRMSSSDRESVQTTLGDRHSRLVDASFAFVSKGIDTIRNSRNGTALATVIPASFMDGEAARKLRESILSDETLSVRLIGRFRGLEYFTGAIIEPAFMVVVKVPRRRHRRFDSVRFVMAEPGHEDEAIRALRREDVTGSIAIDGWEIFDASASELCPDSWSPVPRRPAQLFRTWDKLGVPKVSELFSVFQGIQTGNNDVFLVKSDERQHFVSDPGFTRAFRPIADNISDGMIHEDKLVFYPYDESGSLIFGDELEVASALPTFYSERLSPDRKTRESLANREGVKGKPWWSLNRERAPWQTTISPKIITTKFGQRGSFAFDSTGRFVVLQGNAWIWKAGEFSDPDIPWGYIAILNSRVFEAILAQTCPRVRGGQFNIYKQYINNVHLADLSNRELHADVRAKLTDFGHRITEGNTVDLDELDRLTAFAYRTPLVRIKAALSSDWALSVERPFRELAAQWRNETRFVSSLIDIIQNPNYQSIIALGEDAVPLILSELERKVGHWFYALHFITGEDPVSDDDRGNVRKMAASWLEWGERNGYR